MRDFFDTIFCGFIAYGSFFWSHIHLVYTHIPKSFS